MKTLKHLGIYGALYLLAIGIIVRVCCLAGPAGCLFIFGLILFSLWGCYGILRLVGVSHDEIKCDIKGIANFLKE